ncbi:hypothetical protein MD484_g3343, partial [Candolleomyces efflorescens]
MMLSRVAAIFTILFMTIFASASAIDLVARTDPPPQLPTCSTGPIQCCNSVQSNVNNPIVKLIVGLLNIVVPIVPLVGITCSPVLSILQANACTGQTVCCSNNNFNGVINLGCSPISINL